jgi:hydroxyethylthiazole kinase-like uncharacterized protein yjeF
MKFVLTASEMRAIDAEAIKRHVKGATLMERAGAAVASGIAGRAEKKRALAVIVCGKGNNGGDGFVVARILKRQGWRVRTYLVGRAAEVKGDALLNLKRLKRQGTTVTQLGESARKSQPPKSFHADLQKADVVVDAIFGTGFEGEPRGLAAEVIEAINAQRHRSGTPVFAVDIPSGVDATSGKARLAVRADFTVTMGLPKRGHFLFPGKQLAGDLIVADIGIPREVVEMMTAGASVEIADRSDIRDALPERAPDAHKWSCGHVVGICGSAGLTGAAALASISALRAGAGLVTLAIPQSLNDIMEVKLTEVMTVPVDETPERSLSMGALGSLLALSARATCVAVGPGLSQNEETQEVVRALVARLDRPCVLDADGINAFAGRADLLAGPAIPLVITPHAGEAARLFGVAKSKIAARPIEFAREKARDLGLVFLLKGAPTVIAGPGGEAFINTTGNEGLATAGSGDVLTGIIAGLLAQGAPALDAACCGAYIHGLCGDELKDSIGRGFLAGEIAAEIPRAIRIITEGSVTCRIFGQSPIEF